MSTLVTAVHVIVCLFLMLTVLLQSGKGGGMGAAFGGGNAATVFGGSGASGFLRRLTAIAGTIFMLTSMVLAFLSSRDSADALEKYGEDQRRLAADKEDEQARLLGAGSGSGSGSGSDSGSALMPNAPKTPITPKTDTPPPIPGTTPGSATPPPAPPAGSATTTPPAPPAPPAGSATTPPAPPAGSATTTPPPAPPPAGSATPAPPQPAGSGSGR